jgi:hypothetical protein
MKENAWIIAVVIVAGSWCFVVVQMRGCEEARYRAEIETQHQIEGAAPPGMEHIHK